MPQITNLEPFLTPFPEPSDVFAGSEADITRAAEHLLPLLTIDLEAYDPEFAGLKVHMLGPIEPYEGLVGENTEDYHNYYLRENWFGFRLTEDNKYEFLGDWRYFEAENPESALMTGTMRDDFIKHRDELRESYAARKQYFEKYNQLVWVDTIEGIEKAHAEPNVLEYLESWKEPAVEDNWVGLATIPLKEEPCVVTVEEEEMACYSPSIGRNCSTAVWASRRRSRSDSGMDSKNSGRDSTACPVVVRYTATRSPEEKTSV